MNATITLSHGLQGIDWKELATLYQLARGKRRALDDLKVAFANSYAMVVAMDDGRIVGAARAISDGVYFAAIIDVAVDPGCQGQGVGTRMMQDLLARLPEGKIYLTAVPGLESFYQRFGFRPEAGAMGMVRLGSDQPASDSLRDATTSSATRPVISCR